MPHILTDLPSKEQKQSLLPHSDKELVAYPNELAIYHKQTEERKTSDTDKDIAMKFITSDMKAISVLVAIIMAVALLVVVWHDTRDSRTEPNSCMLQRHTNFRNGKHPDMTRA